MACAMLLLLSMSALSVAPPASAAVSVVATVGSRGPRVVIIQRVVKVKADGSYGSGTAAAVKVWQRANRLPATGVVDSVTWSGIKAVWVRIPAVGNDVSWPQCPKGMGIPSRRSYGLPMPTASAQLVVIGLTNGPGFYPNPCLAAQTAWAKAHHVYAATYAMTTYPTTRQVAAYGRKGPYPATTFTGRLANTGYAQARYNLASMRRVRLASPVMWVDVEPYAIAPWSKSVTANRAVLNGVLAGYRRAGFRVGAYSTKSLWAGIMGSARYRLPEWRTAGPRSAAVARGRCASAYSFQGGPAVLAQWWTSSVDHDMTCPSANTPAVLKAYFHKY
jgi:peptidoglycan hydrolase-like protein with peptidoglycan-binding domain